MLWQIRKRVNIMADASSDSRKSALKSSGIVQSIMRILGFIKINVVCLDIKSFKNLERKSNN